MGIWSVLSFEEELIPIKRGLPRRVATSSLGKRRDLIQVIKAIWLQSVKNF